MTDSISLQIDGQIVEVPPGTTLLDAAALLGIEIPAICYHPNLTANGLCRICKQFGQDPGQKWQKIA